MSGEEGEHRDKVGGDGGGEDAWVHSENAREVFVVDAFGEEVGDDRVYGVGGGRMEGGVEGKCAAGVNAHDF